jgi:5-formyltetrahydrofolate cyclo-ligase
MNSPPSRADLRKTLLAQRRAFTTARVHAAAFAAARVALSAELRSLLQQMEPDCLGIYWATHGEFDAVTACLADPFLASLPWALPYAQKSPPQMHYRAWDQGPLTHTDECRILSSDGPPCLPDVVLVPCLGYTPSGYRLGYGAGYFDRYLAQHPGITAIGLAWAACEISDVELKPQAHDVALTLVLTEHGVAASP